VDIYKAILSVIGLIMIFVYAAAAVGIVIFSISAMMAKNLSEVAMFAIKAAVCGGLYVFAMHVIDTIDLELKEEDDDEEG